MFWLLKLDPWEKFKKFLRRLRNQRDKKCNFANEEDNIIDQISEKGSSIDLRKKILTLGDSVTLDIIVAEANALEAVDGQLNNLNAGSSSDQTINKLGMTQNIVKPCRKCGTTKNNRESS